jgi:uncharacterized repeat protein (TIGR01451 family)
MAQLLKTAALILSGVLAMRVSAAMPLPLLSEGFESGAGGFSTSGLWFLADASGDCWPAHGGTHMMRFSRSSACDYNDGRVKDDSLTSPVVSISGTKPTLSFWHRYQVESKNPTCFDGLRIEVENQTDGIGFSALPGLTISPVSPALGGESVGIASGGGLNGQPQWIYAQADLSAFIGKNIRIRWRFKNWLGDLESACTGWAPDAEMDSFQGWAVDDVLVTSDPLEVVVEKAVGFNVNPSLGIFRSARPSFAAPGDTLTWVLLWRNQTSSSPVLNIWDTLPSGVSYLSSNPPGSILGSLFVASLNPAPNTSGNLTIVARVDSGASAPSIPSDLVNQASIQSMASGASFASNVALTHIRTAALKLSKSVNPSLVEQNGTLTFNLTLTNETGKKVLGVQLYDELPEGFTLIGSNAGRDESRRWVYPPSYSFSMEAGETRVFQLWGTATGPGLTPITNHAYAECSSLGRSNASADYQLRPQMPEAPGLRVLAVYPNPAPQEGWPRLAHVAFVLDRPGLVTMDVHNVAGEKIRRYRREISLQEFRDKPRFQFDWDLCNESNRGVSGGLYVIHLFMTADNGRDAHAFAKIAVYP